MLVRGALLRVREAEAAAARVGLAVERRHPRAAQRRELEAEPATRAVHRRRLVERRRRVARGEVGGAHEGLDRAGARGVDAVLHDLRLVVVLGERVEVRHPVARAVEGQWAAPDLAAELRLHGGRLAPRRRLRLDRRLRRARQSGALVGGGGGDGGETATAGHEARRCGSASRCAAPLRRGEQVFAPRRGARGGRDGGGEVGPTSRRAEAGAGRADTAIEHALGHSLACSVGGGCGSAGRRRRVECSISMRRGELPFWAMTKRVMLRRAS